MIYKIIFLIIIYILYIDISKGIEINTLTHAEIADRDVYLIYIDEFNKYSNENHLNITLKLNLFTKDNSTLTVNGYEDMLELLFKHKSQKYDLYFYDNIFTREFGRHFLPLDDYLPQETFDLYKSGVAPQIGIYNNNWVALPIKLDITFLYCNEEILKKYNQPIPKTWDELIKIGKYVLQKERELNNTEFVAYNGLFTETEFGMCSIYELFYSYRDSIEAPFPNIRSPEIVEAVKMIKKIKDEISSEEIFKLLSASTRERFENGQFLFQKFWYFPYIQHKYVALPGRVPNVSGSSLGGFNLAINKYIDEEHRNAAVIAYNYMVSKEMQKKVVKKYKFYSAVRSLYDDEEVCEIVDCEAFKNTQLIARPTNKTSDYYSYSETFRNYIYEYVYKGISTPEEVLKKIDDITKIYSISIHTKDSVVGLINVVVLIVFSVLMIFFSFFLFLDKYKIYFSFLTLDAWYIMILGCIGTLSIFLTDLGELNQWNCRLKEIISYFSFTLTSIPVFQKLIVNFPERNSISKWVYHHKYIFFLLFVSVDIIMCGLFLFCPFNLTILKTYNGEKYRVCEIKDKFTKIIFYFQYNSKTIIYLCTVMLIFFEWNIKETIYDIRALFAGIVVETISTIVLIMIKDSKLKTNNYISYYYLYSVLIIILSLNNYIFIYAIKIFIGFYKRNFRRDSCSEILSEFKNNAERFNESTTFSKSVVTSNFEESKHTEEKSIASSKTSSIYNKVLEFHKRISIMDINYDNKN